jgi:hypothetical protein
MLAERLESQQLLQFGQPRGPEKLFFAGYLIRIRTASTSSVFWPRRRWSSRTFTLSVLPAIAGLPTGFAKQSRPVLATLIRLLGDFELAEEALHDAFAAAIQQWRRTAAPRQSEGMARDNGWRAAI